jgi:hypothetical protein
MVGSTNRERIAERLWFRRAFALSGVAFTLASACSGDTKYYYFGGGAAGVSGDAGASGQSSAGSGGVTGEAGGAGGAGAAPAGGTGSGGLPAGAGGALLGGAPNAGAPMGGRGGSTSLPTRLGQACVNDIECDPNGTTRLTCLTATSTDLGGGAPPRGVCTLQCALNETCWGIDPTAYCVQFDPLSAYGYCMEGCVLGEPGPLETPAPKCHNRPHFACTPLNVVSTGTPCATSSACQRGLVCLGGRCSTLLSACLPVCTGDQDCSAGLFCDRGEGTCKPFSTAGNPLGTPCNPTSAIDSCSGFCQRIEGVPGLNGMCGEPCNYGQFCAWEDDQATGLCAFTSAVDEYPELGDLGFCAALCDCSSQCRTPGFGCVPSDGLAALTGKPGLCLYPFGEDGAPVETLDCTSP